MKHFIDTETDPDMVSIPFPAGTVLEKGEVFEIHKPSEHPECPKCIEYLNAQAPRSGR